MSKNNWSLQLHGVADAESKSVPYTSTSWDKLHTLFSLIQDFSGPEEDVTIHVRVQKNRRSAPVLGTTDNNVLIGQAVTHSINNKSLYINAAP
jgi:hypothetical protein